MFSFQSSSYVAGPADYRINICNICTTYKRICDVRTWHARCHIDHPIRCCQHRRGIIGVIGARGSFLGGFVTHFIAPLAVLRAACASSLLCPSSIYPSTCLPWRCTLPRHQPLIGRSRIRTIFSIPTLSSPPCSSHLHYFLHAFSLSIPRIHGSTRPAHDELAASRYLVKTSRTAPPRVRFIVFVIVESVIRAAFCSIGISDVGKNRGEYRFNLYLINAHVIGMIGTTREFQHFE